MQEVAVIQGLQAEVIKLQITAGFEGSTQAWQVKLQHGWVEQLVVHAFFDELREVLGIVLAHVSVQHFFAQHFFGDGVHQQTCGGVGVVWVFFDQRTCGQDGGLVNLVHGHAVVQVAHGLSHDGVWFDICAQASARVVDQALQMFDI